jgi:tRNA 2-thiouridine synthesizing protein A
MEAGETLHVTATDPGASKDISAFCKISGNTLIELTEVEDKIIFIIEKGNK